MRTHFPIALPVRVCTMRALFKNSMLEKHVVIIATELGINARQVAATAVLLEEGGTVPFIARYRKERTGELDEVKTVSYTHLSHGSNPMTLLCLTLSWMPHCTPQKQQCVFTSLSGSLTSVQSGGIARLSVGPYLSLIHIWSPRVRTTGGSGSWFSKEAGRT